MFTVLLENIRSLHNVGSIFRTSDACGFNHIYLTGFTGYPPNSKMAKTSLGAENFVQWTYAKDTAAILSQLKQQGYYLIALEKTYNSLDINKITQNNLIKTPLCLIVGNEVTGVSQNTLELSDVITHIPMNGIKESLNVSVAFGIAAYFLKYGIK